MVLSARGGQGKNPYVLSANPCGSSNGSAISVAANMVAVSLGTETDGSIFCPASFNGAVGIKLIVVTDAVYILNVIIGFDYYDAQATEKHQNTFHAVAICSFSKSMGLKERDWELQRGAIVADHLEIVNIDEILNPTSSGEAITLVAEFKLSLNAYLKDLVSSPVRSLADVIAFNQKNSSLIMIENKIDALVTPCADVVPVIAIGGYPGISVPVGFDNNGVPFGIAFGGLTGSEPKLIEIAYGFEQATKVRKPPSLKP
ncbi:hypothetical protein CsSME_00025582 [Camellia sinensis var. sinensis]|uniref:Amidase domain-containing protein n=1 Tax=Camellia sinensis var. sinensis TaxID=542762 RepID=A0A4S4F565_CAMSN|nr:hypothetical protein TEA_015944 [Camellia sinensis var. sinensis]